MRPGRQQGGKRKRGGSAPFRGKKDRDKEVFKKRKYTKNNYVVQEKVVDSVSDESSEEEEQSNYDQLLQVFDSRKRLEDVATTVSSDEDDDVEDDVGDVVEDEENEDGDSGEEDNQEGGKVEEKLEEEEDIEEEEEEEEEGGMEEEEDVELEEENKEYSEESDEGIEDDLEENIDPFAAHYELNIGVELTEILKNPNWKSSEAKFPQLGNVQVHTLDVPNKSVSAPVLGSDPTRLEKLQTQLMDRVPGAEYCEQRLYLKQTLKQSLADPQTGLSPSPLSTELLSIFSLYKDLYWSERTHGNGEELRLAYTLHTLNHVLKTRTKILNNNQKHEKREEGDEALRDQGLCRPKVLIVVPFRESCRRVVHLMEQLLFPNSKGNVANKKRFAEDFPQKETERKNKPDDYYETFAGDIGDSFKLGLAVTKKTLKLYTDFYNSDIIIASPLGLRLVLGTEGERERNYDFLNSIEVMIFDQTEIFLMQNWDHILCLLDDIHKQPKESRGVDFSRVRLWTLDGLNRFYRQTLLFSSTACPEINSVFNRNCSNYFGKARVVNPVVSPSISRVLSDVSLVFHRINSSSAKQSLEDRFSYFKQLINNTFMKDEMDHVLVFFSNYVDFVKGRNWFKSASLDYAEISEYTKDNKMAKARDDFYHNSKHFLLYTERAHFYRRFSIKGIRHLIFYQMPLNPHLFCEMCNLQQEQFQNRRGGTQANMSCTVLYTKYDVSRLAECVGTDRAATMINASKDKHLFTPGS